jgi:hypothetical protein
MGLGVWHLLIIVALALPFIFAAVSIARSTTASGLEKAVWVLIVLAFPLLGPVLWFAIGRKSARGALREF